VVETNYRIVFLPELCILSKKRGENVFCHEDTKAQRTINQYFSVLVPCGYIKFATPFRADTELFIKL